MQNNQRQTIQREDLVNLDMWGADREVGYVLQANERFRLKRPMEKVGRIVVADVDVLQDVADLLMREMLYRDPVPRMLELREAWRDQRFMTERFIGHLKQARAFGDREPHVCSLSEAFQSAKLVLDYFDNKRRVDFPCRYIGKYAMPRTRDRLSEIIPADVFKPDGDSRYDHIMFGV